MDKSVSISGIYTITNLVNNKIYIGYSSEIQKRLDQHKNNLIAQVHPNIHLQRAFNIDKIENFEFDTLEECEEQFLASQENYWAHMLDTHNRKHGYNIKPTNPYGNSRHSAETIEKLRIANTGKKASPETIKKLSDSHKGHIVSKETRLKLSEAAKNSTKLRGFEKGHIMLEDIREKISKTFIEKKIKRSDEFKENCSKRMKGKKPSKLALENSKKFRENNPEYRKFTWIAIEQYDLEGNFVKEWSSISEAARAFKLANGSQIITACKKEHRTSLGYRWKYKDK